MMSVAQVTASEDVVYANGNRIKAGDYHLRCFSDLAIAASGEETKRSYDYDNDPIPTRGTGASGPLPPPSLPALRGVRVARRLATR